MARVEAESTGPLPAAPAAPAASDAPSTAESAAVVAEPVVAPDGQAPGRAQRLVRDVLGRSRDRAPRAPSGRPRPAKRPAEARAPERRYRQTIRKVDLWSVLKISVCFYLCALVVLLAAGAVLWGIASGVGAIDRVESLIGELLGSEDFEFLSWRILRGATLVGLAGVCLMVVCTVLGAAFYNLFSEVLGGIEVTVTEEEVVRRRR